MQKKTKKPRKPKNNTAHTLKNKIAGLSITERIAAALVMIVAIFFIGQQIRIYSERTMYRQAEKQINQFIQEAAKLASSKTKVSNYCSYTSEKFSKGGLGCSVSSSVMLYQPPKATREAMIAEAKLLESGVPWKVEEIADNQQGILRGVYYTVSTMNCSLRYMTGDQSPGNTNAGADLAQSNGLVIEFGCSGPALKEYY